MADGIKDVKVNACKSSAIDVVKDDFGNMYIIDGHHRAAAASVTATPVTINIVTDIINHPSSYRSLEKVINGS